MIRTKSYRTGTTVKVTAIDPPYCAGQPDSPPSLFVRHFIVNPIELQR